MARPKIAAGEVGQVQVTQLANGKWRARARMRDDSGQLMQLRAEGATEAEAREELKSRAKAQTTHTKSIVTAASTIAEAAEAWLPTVRVRAENGTRWNQDCRDSPPFSRCSCRYDRSDLLVVASQGCAWDYAR